MKTNRRDFLKISGMAGLGVAGAGFIQSCVHGKNGNEEFALDEIRRQAGGTHNQHFNMSGYAAPKLDIVRIGFIGLGNRGSAAVARMNRVDGVNINALCDVKPERIKITLGRIKNSPHIPKAFEGTEEIWKKMCERDDIDLVYIATPWHLHAPMAIYAMEQGKHVCVEVPAATTVEDCWKLVETSERTKKHCMMLENCCYDFFELLTLNMARQGYFGEIVHCEGAYIHDLLEGNFTKEKYSDMWRLRENATRNGNLYPTHGLGPVCQIMNINRGDAFDYLVSVSGNDFAMGKMAKEKAAIDSNFEPLVNTNFRGNMNTTTIRSVSGRTIMLQHDVSSPRPYSRLHIVSGTKAYAQKYPLPGRISTGHNWLNEEEIKALETEFKPAIIRRIGEMAKQVGGHGGMDFMMDWRTIDCLRNGLPLDQDVYDAALWSVIGPLSEWSVANRSHPIDVPDFTCESWKKNQPVDVELKQGGNTKVLV